MRSPWDSILNPHALKEMIWYLTFLPHPKVTSSNLGWKLNLYPVLLTIPFNFICQVTMFGKIVGKEFNKLDKIDEKSRFFFVIYNSGIWIWVLHVLQEKNYIGLVVRTCD